MEESAAPPRLGVYERDSAAFNRVLAFCDGLYAIAMTRQHRGGRGGLVGPPQAATN
jgi:hypothetical protein